MTKLEKKVLEKVIADCKGVVGQGPSYDENMRRVDDGDPPGTMDDPMYRLGWQRCHANFVMYLTTLTADAKDQKRYAGK